jgi:hypothetical protein
MNVNYRKCLIFSLNFIVLLWITYEMYFSEVGTDFFGIFIIIVVFFMLLFNLYSFFLNKYLKSKHLSTYLLEIVFIILLFMPFWIVWMLF